MCMGPVLEIKPLALLICTLFFNCTWKTKGCCQMAFMAFMEKRRPHLRHGCIQHCCTTKNPDYNIHFSSPHSFTQLLAITPVASKSSFTSRLLSCASGSVGSVIRSLWWERPWWKMPGSGFVVKLFFSVKMDGKRSHLMSQFAVSPLLKCPALYLGVGLPVH